MTKSKQTAKKRVTVKAWAVIETDPYFKDGITQVAAVGHKLPAIFWGKVYPEEALQDARDFKKFWHGKERGFKIVRCEITYTPQ